MEYIRPTSNCEKADFTYTAFEMEISQAGEEESLQSGP